ncbi:hypothetical protein AX15_001322 [Amanita polypyramis BW_CC]|nr:hypothetical protein AX15_001322 [Amanita polypyramis BW_CC]
MTSSSRRDRRVILIGVGGPTCSGKTTLAKHLQNILPNSVIVHQDDFWPDEVPIHPKYNVQDWDSASGAIAWPRFVDFLRQIKLTGVIPSDHHSHDHLNEQKDIPISDECRQKWISEFNTSREGITWIIVDGFLLYWHPEVVKQLDIRIFLRVPHDVLKQRRHERHGYHTAEGDLWRDPPNYFENIVYPGYVDAHGSVFKNGDIEHGEVTRKIEGLVLIDMMDVTMDEAVDRSCRVAKECTAPEACFPAPTLRK